MELAELKKELNTLIDETTDKQTLLEKIQERIQRETEAKDLSYEDSPQFIANLNEAIRQADAGEVYREVDTMQWLNNRAWRTK